MTILESEIWINCGLATDSHYENKGYEIPRYIDNRGRLKVAKGTKILVRIEDLPKGCSSAKLTKICDDCDKHCYNQSYCTILKSREETDGKDRCVKCGNLYTKRILSENVPYERSLEYYAKENNREYLINEFSIKNNLNPKNVFKTSNDSYLWECHACGSEYQMAVSTRTSGCQNCPYCANRRINHTNCLATTHPNIAKMLAIPLRAYELTYGNFIKEEFICPDCGFRQIKAVYSVVCNGLSCSRCSDGISYPEKFFICLLNELGIYYETQKTFNWSNNKRYDFFIPSLNLIIETHGNQHYEGSFGTTGGKSLQEEQYNDEYKKRLAVSNQINNYIVIDCRKSELEYIKNSILNSKLLEIYNLNKINWLECHKFACNSNLVKTVCDLWNDGIKNTVEIGKIVKLEQSTVRKYLKQGNELFWCDYGIGKNNKKII